MCNKYPETVIHLFIRCEKVAPFWIEVEDFMKNFSEEEIHFSVDTVLWNRIIVDNPYHVKNFICLLAKHYIYKKKWQEKPLNVHEFKSLVYEIKNREKYIATVNGKLQLYAKKWNDTQVLDQIQISQNNVGNVRENYVLEYLQDL